MCVRARACVCMCVHVHLCVPLCVSVLYWQLLSILVKQDLDTGLNEGQQPLPVGKKTACVFLLLVYWA